MDTDGHRSGIETAEYAKYAEREKGGWGLFRIFWVGSVVFVLYVLSTGPVMKACGPGRYGVVLRIYAPLIVASRVPTIQAFFKWYISDVWKTPMRG
jgi:hypothetical protein